MTNEKRYSISKEQCTCGISELYDNVAKIMGVSDLSKVVYDCRKLSITKKCWTACMSSIIQRIRVTKPSHSCMVPKQIWMEMATKSR